MLFVTTGYILCKTDIVKHEHTKVLSALGVHVFFPATIFNTFSSRLTVPCLKEKGYYILSSAVIIFILACIAKFISRRLTKNPYGQRIYEYTLTNPNYGYVGYPLVSALFGQEMLFNVMIFTLPLSFYSYTYGYSTLTKRPVSFKKLINTVTASMALGAAVGLLGLPVPYVASSFLSTAASCMGPISMLLAGMVISEFPMASLLKIRNTYIAVAFRLLIIPCAVAFALRTIGFEDLVIPSLMVFSMPCGLNTIIFPRLIGEDCKPGASLSLVSSILCCFTIPLCLQIFS